MARWIESLEQVLDERADSIYTAIHGMQPKSVLRARVVRIRLELPILDHVYQGLGEVGRQFIALLSEAGSMGQVEGIRLFRFICKRYGEHGLSTRPMADKIRG